MTPAQLPVRRLALGLLVAVLGALLGALLGVGGLLPALPASAASTTPRIWGLTKFDTAVAVSKDLFPNGATEVFIANEAGGADAIVAGPAAASRNAPILLADAAELPQVTRDELARLTPTRITIIGGTTPIGPGVEAAIRPAVPGAAIECIWGQTAQGTAVAVAQRFFPSPAEVLLVNEGSKIDLATAGSVGARYGYPIVTTGRAELTSVVVDALKAMPPARTTLIGGGAQIVDRVGRQAVESSRGTWSRVGADDPYTTNGLVVGRYYDRAAGTGVAAVLGDATPDFPSATIHGRFGIPLLMLGRSCADSEVIARAQGLATNDSEPIRLIGGGANPDVLKTACPKPVTPSRTCSIASSLADPNALTTNALFSVGGTSATLLDRGAGQMVPAGSTFKIMTAIAAYHVLGPDFRIPTYLYHGTKPGSYVISGGGDPTLRSGWTSVYPGAPTIIAFSNLARSLGATSASYDSWLYPGAAWHPGWAPVERTNGYMAPMDALMMDGGRADPNATTSPRTANPAWDAGVRFASLTGVRFDPTIRADPSQGVVGMTDSAPVRDLVSQMLRESDNVLAEALARQVAIKLGYQGSWDQVAPAMHAVMWSLGIDPAAGVYASDGSGLSNQSNASPRFIDRLLEYIEDGAGGTKELTMMFPRNGMAGSLASRLTSLPTGSVYAKTGWVDYGYGLAGYLVAADGTWLRFAVYVWKPRSGAFVTNANRDALDRIIAASWRCGSSLAPS